MRTWGVTGGLLLLGAGVGNLYLASVLSRGFTLFGVDGFLLAGLGQIVGGAFLLTSEYLRPPLSSVDAD